MTAGTDLRLLRAAVFTAACVALSAAGHVLAAGVTVPLWALGTGCALVFAMAAPLAGRERTLPGIAVALALGQVALHTLFSCCSRPAHGGRGSGDGLHALASSLLCNDGAARALTDGQARQLVSAAGLATGGGHGGGNVPAGGPSAAGTPAECLRAILDAALAQLSGPMLLGHLLAAVAAGWLLRRGEAALWRLVRVSTDAARTAEDTVSVRALRWALRLVRALLRGTPVPDTRPSRAAHDATDRTAPARNRVLTGGVTRRGPPGHKDWFAPAA